MPWIHREDLVDAIVFLLEKQTLMAPCSAPHPTLMPSFPKR